MFQSKKEFSQNIVSLVSTMMGVGSTLLLTNVANASTLKVEVTNVGPVNGMGLAQTWFGIHDGSFDLFDAGDPASRPIEILAEDGFTGLEARVPGVVDIIQRIGLNLPAVSPELQDAIDNGEDLSTFVPDNTIAGILIVLLQPMVGFKIFCFPLAPAQDFSSCCSLARAFLRPCMWMIQQPTVSSVMRLCCSRPMMPLLPMTILKKLKSSMTWAISSEPIF